MIYLNKELNLKLLDFFNSKNYIQILYGSRLSGKSYAAAQKIILLSLRNKNLRTLVIRKTYPALRDTSLMLILDILEKWDIPYNRKQIPGGDEISFFNHSTIRFRSLDDPEKIKSSAYNVVWVEEATELKEIDLDQILLTLRRKGLKMCILTFNPPSRLHWIYKRFFANKTDEDVFIRKINYQDNPFLSEMERKRIENFKKINPSLARSWVYGNFTDMEGTVFRNWEIIDKLPDLSNLELVGGLDFGWVHPNAFVLCGIYENQIYIIDELKESYIQIEDFLYKIEKLLEKYKISKSQLIIYPDPARSDLIEKVKEKGFTTGKTKKEVIPSIHFLQNFQIKIHKKCEKFIDEISTYSWDKDKDGNFIEKPVKQNDDLIDAFRYAIYSHKSLKKIIIL